MIFIGWNLRVRLDLKKFIFLLCLTACTFPLLSQAQEMQTRHFSAGSDSLFLSPKTVIQSATFIQVGADTLPSSAFRWWPNSKGVSVPNGLAKDATVYFKTLSFDLSEPLFQRPLSQYGIPVIPGKIRPEPIRSTIERPFNGLTRSGSISRSIQFGNGQDAVLNSNFNLQLSGKLSDKTTVKASIADNSLPVQADGFSQQIREFDQIFIELESEDFGRVRAGDIQLQQRKSLFLNFDKRVTGGLVETSFGLGDGKMDVTALGALARGRFHRNTFFGQEGNQGPYRLTGARGENFIFIISGSERVYIDGVLLQRGADADYIINYASGELTFTALRPITRENRINIEFQYTDQSFLRSVVYGGVGYTDDKWSFQSQIFSEQDNPDQPLQTSLSDDEKRLLAAAGDNWENLFISTIRPLSGIEGEIPYRLTDSLGLDSVLIYAPNDTGQLYTASFRQVGTAQGDYVRDQALATGNVYRWMPRVNGVPQGDYAPVRGLQAPNQLQVFSQQIGYEAEKLGNFNVEWALSKRDENRFSSRDKGNDIGQAARLSWNKEQEKWTYQIDYQFNQKNFNTVERIRQVEFARDWNLRSEQEEVHLAQAGVKRNSDSLSLDANVSGIASGKDYRGLKPSLNWNWKSSNWESIGQSSLLLSNDSSGSSEFLRERIRLSRKFGSYRVGVNSQGEWNTASGERFRQSGGYAFFDNELFQEIGDSTESLYLRLGLFQRTDDSANIEGQLRSASLARGVRLSTIYQPKSSSSIGAYVQYRDLRLPSELQDQRRASVTSRLHYRQAFWRKSIQWNSFYESGISNEPLRSFSYIAVPNGTGLYTWVDYNGNEVQELNEFELTQLPGQGNYVRIYTPNRQFQQAGRTLLTQTFGFQPLALLRSSSSVPFWSRWSTQWNYSLENVNAFNDDINPLNPFYQPSLDSMKLARRQSNRISIFFNRTSLKFGGDYSYLDQVNRQIQAYGSEMQTQQLHRISLRFLIVEGVNIQPSVELGNKSLETPGFQQRNYRLLIQMLKFRISWQLNKQLNLSAESSWRQNHNTLSVEYLQAFQQTAEVQYSLSGKSNLNAGIDFRTNAFTGNAFSPVGYEMLQGLLPGNNYLWNLYWEKQLFDFLQLNLRYDGRSSVGTDIIHTASMQVKALF
jgi:hypothetical protein